MVKINFKKLLSLISVLAIATPATLTVISCNKQEENINQEIIVAINQNTYNKQIDFSTKADFLKSKITVDFIKSELQINLIKNFKDELFELNNIINDQMVELSDKDLEETGKIETKIKYNYGEFQNQTTNLIIEIKDKEDYQLNSEVNALIKATDGNIYAGTNNAGIWKISSNENPEKLEILKEDSQPFNEVINILIEGKKNKLYAKTIEDKIWEIDVINNSAILKFQNYNVHDITALFQASNGRLYVGNSFGNVYEIDLENSQLLKGYLFKKDFSHISNLIEAPGGNIYITTLSGNIWTINLKEQEYSILFSFNEKLTSIFDMKQINYNEFLFITKNKVYHYNLKNKQLTEKFSFFDNKDRFTLIGVNKNNFLVITKLGKLYEIDLEKNKMNNHINLENELIVYSFLLTDNNIYIGTTIGIKKLLTIK